MEIPVKIDIIYKDNMYSSLMDDRSKIQKIDDSTSKFQYQNLSQFNSINENDPTKTQFQQNFIEYSVYNPLQFNPFLQPPEMNLVNIHQQASKLGVEDNQKMMESEQNNKVSSLNQAPNFCPCCNRKIEKQQLPFWRLENSNSVKQYGCAVTSLFELFKLWIILLTLILPYCLYYLYWSQKICVEQKSEVICLQSLGIYLISEPELRLTLEKQYKNTVMINFKFITLCVITLYSVFVFNLHLNRVNKKQEAIKFFEQKIKHRSLMFFGVYKELSKEELQQKFEKMLSDTKLECKIEIENILNIYDYSKVFSKYNEKVKLYNKFNNLKLSKLQKNSDQYQNLIIQNKEINEELDSLLKKPFKFSNKCIITFKTQTDKNLVYYTFDNMSICTKIKCIFLQLFSKSSNIDHLNTFSLTPQPSEIIWQNIGYKSTWFNIFSIFFIFVKICIVLLITYLFTEIGNLKSSYMKVDQSKIPFKLKIVNYLYSFILFVAAFCVKYLFKVSTDIQKIYLSTTKSQIIIVMTLIFTLLNYVLVPSLQDLDLFRNNKLQEIYSLYNLFAIQISFCLLSIAFEIFNPTQMLYYLKLFYFKKNKHRYNQQQAHQIAELPQFTLEDRLIFVYKSGGLSIFMVFLLPISVPFFFITLIICFFIAKYYLQKYQTLKVYKGGMLIKQSQFIFTYFLTSFLQIGYGQTEYRVKYAGAKVNDSFLYVQYFSIVIPLMIILERSIDKYKLKSKVKQSFSEKIISDFQKNKQNANNQKIYQSLHNLNQAKINPYTFEQEKFLNQFEKFFPNTEENQNI